MCAKENTQLFPRQNDLKSDLILKQILDSSPFPTAVADENDKQILYWSKSAQKLFGHLPKTVEEWHLLAYPDPKYRNEVVGRWKSSIKNITQAGEVVYTGENRINCKDGSIVICDLYARTISGFLIVTLHDITESKQAEEKLNLTKDRLIEAQQFSKLGWWELDINKNLITWSDELYKIFGITHDEDPLSYERVMKLIRPDYHDYHNERIELLEKTGAADFEYPVKRPDGKTVWIWSKGKLKLDKDGNPAYMFGITQDITDRKKAEEKLKIYNQKLIANEQQLRASNQQLSASEQQLRASNQQLKASEEQLKESQSKLKNIVENSTNMFYAHDNDHKLTFVSPQVREYLGCEPEEALTNWTKFATDNPINEKAFNYTLKALETGERQPTYELELQRKDGRKILVEVREAPVIENGKVMGIVGSLVDISERKKAETELKRKEILLRSSVESPMDMIILSLDKDYRYLYFNRAHEISMKTAYGKTPEIGQCIFDYMTSKDDIQRIKEKYDKGLKGQGSVSIEAYGEIIKRYFEIHINPIVGENEQIIGITSYAHDITEMQKVHNSLKASEERYRSLVEDSLQGMVIAQNDPLRLSFASKPMQNISGYTPEELTGFTPEQNQALIHPDDRQEFFSNFARRLIGEKVPPHNEYRIIHKDGSIHWVELFSSRVEFNEKPAIQAVFLDITQRKRAEEDLIKNQQFLKKAQEIGQIGTWHLDLGKDILTWTEENYKIFEVPYGTKMNYVRFLECVHPEDREYLNKEWIASIKGKPYDIEHRLLVNGKIKWVREKAEFLCDNKNKPIEAFGVTQDITDRKVAEQELAKANDNAEKNRILLKTMINATPDLVWLKDINGVYASCNKRFEDFFGKPESEIVGKTDYDFLDKDLADFFRQNDNLAMNAGEPIINEEEITFASDGHSEILETIKTPLINKNNEIIGVLGVGRDITDRKIAEDRLKERNAYIETIMDNMPIGFALNTITDGKVQYMNNKFEEIYGWPRDVLNNVSIFFEKVFPEDDYRKKMKSQIMADMQSGDPDRMQWPDLKIVTNTNEERYVHAFNIPLIEQDLMISTVQDTTKRKIAEDELIKAKERAEESDKLKSSFLANMSHEIRTPMNGILGFTSLLEKPDLSEDKREQYIQIIKKSGDRMLNTVNDLINISKIETGQIDVKPEVCNPCALVKDHIEFFKPSAEEKGLTLGLEQQCACQDERIMMDVNKLDSIITNLVRNAIKYTETGSIIVKCNMNDKKFRLDVCDTGEGIPKDRQEAIFDRFVQADLSDTKARQGSGLGLSIVKAYVKMMKGKISLESEPGKGSCFTVELPVIKANKKLVIDRRPLKVRPDKAFHKVLIVEDDDISHQHLSISLEDHANSLLHAENGIEAVRLTKDNDDIDLILMDIKMPVMDGYEATRKIREFNKDVVIVAQTAYALPEDKQKAQDAGCNAYITKPIDIDALLKLVSN